MVTSQSPRVSQVARRAAGRRRRQQRRCWGSGSIAQSEGPPSITKTQALWIEAEQRPGERTLTIGVPSFIVGPRQDGLNGFIPLLGFHLPFHRPFPHRRKATQLTAFHQAPPVRRPCTVLDSTD